MKPPISKIVILIPLAVLLVVIILSVIQVAAHRQYQFEAYTYIDSPMEKIFPYLHKPELMKKWITGLTSSTPFSNILNGVGDRRIETMVSEGEIYELESEIRNFRPSQALTFLRFNEGFEAIVDYELLEKNGGTNIRIFQDIYFKKLLFKLFAGIINQTMEEKAFKDLNELKSLMEDQ